LAGHTDCGTHLLDTHSTPVCDDVWGLYRYAVRRFGARSTLVEWDEDIPDWGTLEHQSELARKHADAALKESGDVQ
jgi:uncharacterized protein (UPF0276 family)